MILISFSSAEDALSNAVKKYEIFSSQGTENPPFHIFGTPGIAYMSIYILLNSSDNIQLTNVWLG